MKIKIPNRLEQEFLCDFNKILFEVIDYENVTIDFSELHFSRPYSMLCVGSYIKRFVHERKTCGLETYQAGIDASTSAHSYLMHIGFFDYIGLKLGKKIGEASGSNTYFPIHKISHDELLIKQSPPYTTLADVIHIESKSLAKVILGNASKESLLVISYCLREIIRNVFEHSGSENCFICGQQWYDSVQIAIIDEGVGIRNSLQTKYKSDNDKDAILYAIQPGISGKNIEESTKNKHDNSGFGLYILSEIGKQFGWFTVSSGNSKLILSNNNKHDEKIIHNNGTSIGLHLDKYPKSFQKTLDEIIHNGEFEAYMEGRSISASITSRTI